MSERLPRTVEIDRQENRDGGIGVQVRVDGGEARRRSTMQTTAGEPTFTGRGTELCAIEVALEAQRVVVLHGAPGLGKSVRPSSRLGFRLGDPERVLAGGNTTLDEIAEVARRLVALRNWGVTDGAKRLGISHGTLSRWASRREIPT